MKSFIYLAVLPFVVAHPKDLPWHPPGPGDVRSPCPMLNVLANHGILPHDGKNIGHDDILTAFPRVLNFDNELSEVFFKMGISTTLNPNATTFDLDDTNRHDIVEHDASLSRGDFFFGDDHTFNQTIWDQSRSYWKGPIIDIQGAADATAARVRTCRATNPTFSLNGDRLPLAAGGAGIFTAVLGNHTSGTVEKCFVREMFEQERLPVTQGWKKSEEEITVAIVAELTERIFAATGLATNQARAMMKRRGFVHGGLSL